MSEFDQKLRFSTIASFMNNDKFMLAQRATKYIGNKSQTYSICFDAMYDEDNRNTYLLDFVKDEFQDIIEILRNKEYSPNLDKFPKFDKSNFIDQITWDLNDKEGLSEDKISLIPIENFPLELEDENPFCKFHNFSWYQPATFCNSEDYGNYISKKGVLHIAYSLLKIDANIPIEQATNIAFVYLLYYANSHALIEDLVLLSNVFQNNIQYFMIQKYYKHLILMEESLCMSLAIASVRTQFSYNKNYSSPIDTLIKYLSKQNQEFFPIADFDIRKCKYNLFFIRISKDHIKNLIKLLNIIYGIPRADILFLLKFYFSYNCRREFSKYQFSEKLLTFNSFKSKIKHPNISLAFNEMLYRLYEVDLIDNLHESYVHHPFYIVD